MVYVNLYMSSYEEGIKVFICYCAVCVGGGLVRTVSGRTVFAHRASRFEYDENTLPAFKACYEQGIRGFETDIRMSKDGQLVVNHDETFARLTPCTGAVESMTSDEIRKLTTFQGNKILFLDELVGFLSDKDGLYVEFEMKVSPISSYPEDRLREYCDKLYNAVMSKKPEHSTYLFTSSSRDALNMMRKLHPDADMLMIFSKPVCDETIQMAEAMGIKRIGCNMNGTTRSMVKRQRKPVWPFPFGLQGLLRTSCWACISVRSICAATGPSR